MKITIFRWHSRDCKHHSQHPGDAKIRGRAATNCDCPLWVDRAGCHPRLSSLRTRDWEEALRTAAKQEEVQVTYRSKLQDAVNQYLKDVSPRLSPDTIRNTRSILRRFVNWLTVDHVDLVKPEMVESYIMSANLAPSTARAALERFNHFFRHCRRRKWCGTNPIEEVERPKSGARPVVYPFDESDLEKMLDGASRLRTPYGRKRARAAILVLYYTGMRIRDVATLRRDAIDDNGQLRLRTHKNKKDVMIPVPPVVIEALRTLPRNRTYDQKRRLYRSVDSDYFFWSGLSDKRTAAHSIYRNIREAFIKAGYWTADDPKSERAHAHRFRHTMVTRLLARGATAVEVADICGMTPDMVVKRYAQWSSERQARVNDLVRGMWG